MALLRIDKILSATGAYSRSEAAALIRQGAVTANGAVVSSGSEKFDPDTAVISVLGQRLTYSEYHYIMMYKPAGYVSATEDRYEHPVTELLDPRLQRLGLFPAGRLDKDAEGLLILTDDGDYAHRVMSPKSGVIKVYYVETDGTLTQEDVSALQKGVILRDGTQCLPASLTLLGEHSAYVAISEGKYHQVKRMLASLGKPVTYLKRVSIGSLGLEASLKPGEYREMSEVERSLVFDN